MKPNIDPGARDILLAASTADLLDLMAVHIDVDKVQGPALRLNIIVTDTGESFATELAHSNLSYVATDPLPEADATLTITRAPLIGLIAGTLELDALLENETAYIEGSASRVQALFDSLSADSRHFAIVPNP